MRQRPMDRWLKHVQPRPRRVRSQGESAEAVLEGEAIVSGHHDSGELDGKAEGLGIWRTCSCVVEEDEHQELVIAITICCTPPPLESMYMAALSILRGENITQSRF